MSYQVKEVLGPFNVGEGPHWDVREQALYFINVYEQEINKYVPATGVHTKAKFTSKVNFVIPVEGTKDQFVIGSLHKVVVVQWDGKDGSPLKVVKELAELDMENPTNSINDGKADARGRLYTGTMSKELAPSVFEKSKCSLYKVERDQAKKLADGITMSNGMVWDLKGKYLFQVDTFRNRILKYDYDIETGDVSNRKVLVDFEESKLEGNPDGMTIDTDGNLWVALYEGSGVFKIDPETGKVLQKVSIPAWQTTSVAFGGPNLDELYVTSAALKYGSFDAKYPNGCIFKVTGLGVKGLPPNNFKLY